MDEINLHFTGDFHAITAAHNLLAAMVDNHIYWGNARGIDTRRIAWRRVLDMNDRALRETVLGWRRRQRLYARGRFRHHRRFGGDGGLLPRVRPRGSRRARLGRMVVGSAGDRRRSTAADLNAAGAMTALLKGALRPNLVQTLEGSPAFVHGGPVRQYRPRLQLGDRDPGGAQARRLRRDGSGLRRRSRRREILRHQVPKGGT